MPAKKTAMPTNGVGAKDIKATRPRIPAAYGVAKGKDGLLQWSHVETRMQRATVYWICSSARDLPHATPVDGLWLDGRLYFGGDPSTKWQRNLRANPAACVHLDSAEGVLILHGVADITHGVDRATAGRLAAASKAKYGYGMAAEEYEKADIAVYRPRVVIAWTDLTKRSHALAPRLI